MDQNLRKGDFAEQLGVYLLRPFTAVAPVLRPDDHGIDAVGTLLRPESGRRMAPEETFYAQFKASSVSSLTYQEEQLLWLAQLQLPLFIASVDIQQVRVRLYTAHELSSLMANCDIAQNHAVRLILGGNRTKGDYTTPEGKLVEVRLGPPILEWCAAEAAENSFVQKAYSIMKPWVRCECNNIALRAIRMFERLDWRTNEAPAPGGRMCFSSSFFHKGLQPDMEAMKPYVEKLSMDVLNSFGQTPNEADVRMYIQLIEFYERHGIPLHNTDILRTLAVECLKKTTERV